MTATASTASPSHLLEVRNLRKEFPLRSRSPFSKPPILRAVDDLSFSIAKGETLGLVGESGCGKTTTGRLVLRLIEPTSGEIRFRGENLMDASAPRLRQLRQDLQIIFQDPFGALNPRMTAGELIVEPLVIHGIGDSVSREQRLRYLLDIVGLAPQHAGRFPHEFSGGQRQRLCIARALSLEPAFVVCDEAVSALDVSVQAQILNLMHDLRRELSLTYLFISHDLGVVRHISDRIAVMYLGQIVELGPKLEVFDRPSHPYTQVLLDSIPSEGKGRKSFFTVAGDVPSAANPPSGCRFHTRCPMAAPICSAQAPPPVEVGSGHMSACHFAETARTGRAVGGVA